MYKVTVVTDGKEYPLLNQVLRLENPTLKEYAGNSPGYLKFKITPKHPYYDKILPLSSELFVYEDGMEVFRGRSMTTEEEFNGHIKSLANQISHTSATASSGHLSSRVVLWSL